MPAGVSRGEREVEKLRRMQEPTWCIDTSVLMVIIVRPRIRSGAGSELVEGRSADRHHYVDTPLTPWAHLLTAII